MIKYPRLTFIEREEISRQIASKFSIRSIAKNLNRSPATISREIRRSCLNRNYYRAIAGQKYAQQQLHKSSMNRKLDRNITLRDFVYHHVVKKRWAPEQVAKRLKILYPDDVNMHISHESIYSYLYVFPRNLLKKEIISSLRRSHQLRRIRKLRQKTRPIQDYLSIEKRPAEITGRAVPGHWEGDMLIGSNFKA